MGTLQTNVSKRTSIRNETGQQILMCNEQTAAAFISPITAGTFSVLPFPVIQPNEKKNRINKTKMAPIPVKIFTHKGFFNNLSMASNVKCFIYLAANVSSIIVP